jgi:tricorn protease
MPISGGPAKQLTYHSEGFTPHDWFPDGQSVLAEGWRDYTGFSGRRPFKVNISKRQAPELICDAYAANGRVSPDGKRILFTRENVLLYRKGYKGSRASQIWLYDMEAESFEQLCSEPGGTRSPLWRPDGDGFYFLSQRSGSFNLWEHDLKSGEEKQLTFHEDASVVLPTISGDGKTIVYRWMFDFYRLNPRSKRSPKKIEIWHNSDRQQNISKRRWYNKIWNNGSWGTLDWTDDNLEMVFCAGGDLWVMDTVIKEPVRVFADSASDAISAVFSPDAETILFLRDRGDRVTLWRARRGDPSAYWYQNRGFKLEQLTDNDEHLSHLSFSPDGKKIVFAVNNADLYLADPDGSNRELLFDGVDKPYSDWSPDSKWLACQLRGHDDNWDIWIVSTTGARKPYNVTRYPDWDGTPRWSPNGRMLAFVGERENREELDLFYVFLAEGKEPPAQHITDVATAEQRLRASRPPTSNGPEDDGNEGTAVAEVEQPKQPPAAVPTRAPAAKPVPTVEIDFDGLHRRSGRMTAKPWPFNPATAARTAPISCSSRTRQRSQSS